MLTGPAGSGKTTVLRNLAQEMDLHIVEWINCINANNIIQRPVMPGQEKEAWRPASLDEGTSISGILCYLYVQLSRCGANY